MANQIFPVNTIPQRMNKPRLDVYYPLIVTSPVPLARQKMNMDIYRLTDQLLTDQGYYENQMTTCTGWYELKTNERAILSLYLGNYAFSGGAHGLTIIKALTFTTNDARSYTLKELFKPGSDYVAVLSAIVAAQIKQRDIQLLDDFKGIRPDQDFYIADKCLVLYFQLYEITPYALGFQFFPISVYEIQDIIDENGPLGRMLGEF